MLFALGARFQIGKALLRLRKLRFPDGLAILFGAHLLRFAVDERAHLDQPVPDAFAPFGRRSALGDDAVALARGGQDALLRDAHGAFAGLDLADQPLHGLALFRRLRFERRELFLNRVARRAGLFELLVRLQDRFAQRLHRILQLPDARLIALGAQQKDV